MKSHIVSRSSSQYYSLFFITALVAVLFTIPNYSLAQETTEERISRMGEEYVKDTTTYMLGFLGLRWGMRPEVITQKMKKIEGAEESGSIDTTLIQTFVGGTVAGLPVKKFLFAHGYEGFFGGTVIIADSTNNANVARLHFRTLFNAITQLYGEPIIKPYPKIRTKFDVLWKGKTETAQETLIHLYINNQQQTVLAFINADMYLRLDESNSVGKYLNTF